MSQYTYIFYLKPQMLWNKTAEAEAEAELSVLANNNLNFWSAIYK